MKTRENTRRLFNLSFACLASAPTRAEYLVLAGTRPSRIVCRLALGTLILVRIEPPGLAGVAAFFWRGACRRRRAAIRRLQPVHQLFETHIQCVQRIADRI